MVGKPSGQPIESTDCHQLYSDGGEPQESENGDELHYREEEPQGLLYFTRYDSVPIMVDALFDAPTSREFTATELAEKSGLTPRSVRDHIDILHKLGVVKEVDNTDRVTLDLTGLITWTLRELDGQIKVAQSGRPPRRNEPADSARQEDQSLLKEQENESLAVMDTVRQQATQPGSHAD